MARSREARPFFVVGASARDIVLKFGFGIETIRATNDIDLGSAGSPAGTSMIKLTRRVWLRQERFEADKVSLKG